MASVPMDALGVSLTDPLVRDFAPQWLTGSQSDTYARLGQLVLGQAGSSQRLYDSLSPRFVAPEIIGALPGGLVIPYRPQRLTPRNVVPALASRPSPVDAAWLWLIKAYLSRDDVLWLLPDLLGDPLAVAAVGLGVLLNALGDPALAPLVIILLGYVATDIFTRIDRHRRGDE